MPENIPTTISLTVCFVITLFAVIFSIRRLHASETLSRNVERFITIAVCAILSSLYVYRALLVKDNWQPLSSHVDGLIVLTLLIAATTIYYQWHTRMRGVSLFLLPMLTIILLWAVCASWWSWRAFHIHSLWGIFHLICVYLGMAVVSIGACAGVMFLYVNRQLKSHNKPKTQFRILGRLASLEVVENIVIWAATGGFVLITLGLISGVIIAQDGTTTLGAQWWLSPKVLITLIAWVIFMLLMHVKHAPRFRGKRAAVLAIAGFILIFIVMGLSQLLGRETTNNNSQPPSVSSVQHGGAI